MATGAARILLIDDDRNFRKVMALALRERGYDIEVAENGKDGLEREASSPPEVILCDLKMPVMDGLGFLAEYRRRGGRAPVIVLTAFGSIESAVEAMRAGAYDYVTKPINRDALQLALDRALDHQRLLAENRLLRERVAGGRAVDRLLGTSPAMAELRKTLARLADSDATVLIRGESGAGKELAARALHFDGPRATRGRFVVINCASIPGELLESELFGHVKGSFTGASADRTGKFEAADGGTLFLDEIGDMPLALQAKLLRALQEGEIERIGENETRKVNVRVVAATNQALEDKIAAGSFREDLFYRLAVVPIRLPPLRDRLKDLPILAKHFLARYGAPEARIADDTLALLRRHSWPGNVRELENLIQRACALKPDLRELTLADVEPLGPSLRPSAATAPSAVGLANLARGATVELPAEGVDFENLERALLEAALKKAGGNRTEGARLLRMPRQAFIYRLQKFGIVPGYGRQPADAADSGDQPADGDSQ